MEKGESMTKPLTPKQEAFATGIASGLSQADAYRQAYPKSQAWKDETVWSKASAMAKHGEVQARIQELRDKAAEANEVSIERIVAEVVKVAFANQRDLMAWGPSGVKLRPSDELTDEQAAAVSEVSESTSATGGSLKLKTHDKLGALRFLAELKGYLVKKSEITGANGKDLMPEAPKGVLVVPGVLNEADWEKMMAKQGGKA
jgi:phage terminase small subunit